MTNFEKTITQIHNSQKLTYLISATLVLVSTFLWIADIKADIKVKSDRPSLTTVQRDRLK